MDMNINKKNIKLFDAHCDTSSALFFSNSELHSFKGHTDLKRGLEYGAYAQFYAVFTVSDDPFDSYRKIRDYFFKEIDKNSDKVAFCKNRKDALNANAAGKTAAFLSIEGGEFLNCSISELENAAELGLIAVNITWNFENALSGSNAQSPDKGLTKLGVDFVKRAQELDVLVDVSHISDPGFWDVISIAEKPIIASHSNSRALCGHSRNLTDDMFKALIKNGGVAGFNVYSEFVGVDPTVENAADHIEHFLDLGGAKNIGIGADFDGCDTMIEGFAGLQHMDRLYECLLRRNIPEDTVNDIFYNNFMNLIR